ncbi:MAG: threonine/serine exporter family protein [Oscillospiraceae bacterium]|nr:threonine/serine exporter family protein [Oscillospiraceae bacterium]
MMRDWIIQLATAFLGSLGFSLVFGVRRRHLFAASLGGLFAWAIYLAVDAWLHSGFLACLLASAFSVLYSELLARLRKTPATLFLVPAIIPLVPGSSLYYAMSCVVRKDFSNAREYGTLTLEYALAIAAGISFVLAVREIRTRKT